MNQDLVALGDALQGSPPNRGVPRGDGQGEKALAGLRNGEPQLGEPMYYEGGMFLEPVGVELPPRFCKVYEKPWIQLVTFPCSKRCSR